MRVYVARKQKEEERKKKQVGWLLSRALILSTTYCKICLVFIPSLKHVSGVGFLFVSFVICIGIKSFSPHFFAFPAQKFEGLNFCFVFSFFWGGGVCGPIRQL